MAHIVVLTDVTGEHGEHEATMDHCCFVAPPEQMPCVQDTLFQRVTHFPPLKPILIYYLLPLEDTGRFTCRFWLFCCLFSSNFVWREDCPHRLPAFENVWNPNLAWKKAVVFARDRFWEKFCSCWWRNAFLNLFTSSNKILQALKRLELVDPLWDKLTVSSTFFT